VRRGGVLSVHKFVKKLTADDRRGKYFPREDFALGEKVEA
jgi:hypothetical protein